jgi:hypothetical protein
MLELGPAMRERGLAGLLASVDGFDCVDRRPVRVAVRAAEEARLVHDRSLPDEPSEGRSPRFGRPNVPSLPRNPSIRVEFVVPTRREVPPRPSAKRSTPTIRILIRLGWLPPVGRADEDSER